MSVRTPGTKVVCHRDRPGTGTWGRYAGRQGWVVRVNRETFANGRSHVEIGVSWRAPGRGHTQVDAWFLPDELEVAP